MWLNDPTKAEIEYGDISQWDTSSVTDMHELFYESHFNGDISGWNVSSVTTMYCMFYNSHFNGDISAWNVSSVTNMRYMFNESRFNGDIRRWRLSPGTNTSCMFLNCPVDYIQFWRDREDRWVRRRAWITTVAPYIRGDGQHETTDSPIQRIFNVPDLVKYITRLV